ncbi:MAG: sugar ABC transporter permease [Bifidobacteriaceae bacterium]|jgi:ABC-type sugar transport system permease subunit|nr:sugar ABC transporter permease [Bifidobacteriaceae bacterium]
MTDIPRARAPKAGARTASGEGLGKRLRHAALGPKPFIVVTLAPAVTILGVFVYWPIVRSVYMSMFSTRQLAGRMESRFVGTEQYERLFADELFHAAIRNTAFYAVLGTVGCLLLGLGTALLLVKIGRGRGFYSALMFAPYVVPWAAWTVLWTWLYDPKFGPANYILGLFGFGQLAWLKSAGLVIPSFVILSLFKRVGFAAIIFMVGLQAISRDLYEAAEIDGAGPVRKLISISLPQLRPVVVFLGTTFFVQGLQLFTEPYVMTQGGPGNASTSLVYMLYTRGIQNNNFGYGSALAVVLFIVVFGISILFRRSNSDA